MYELLIFALAMAGWVLFLYYLVRTGIGERLGISFMGPFLMLKTTKGRNLLERISHAKRFWRVFGDVAIAIVLATMALMTGLLIWAAIIAPTLPPDKAPTPQTIIGLPGINPVIPLWYGIFGLVVAIVSHEFCHGILARLAKVKIVSLGVLLMILPLGAFVEPDEAELKNIDKRSRARMFAAGPAVNIIFAVVTAILFSLVMMPNVSLPSNGAAILGVYAAPAGGNLSAGMLITSVDGTAIHSNQDFEAVMAAHHPGEVVAVTTVQQDGGGLRTFNLQLGSRYDQTGREADRDKAIMGVRLVPDPSIYNPFGQVGKGNTLGAFLGFIFLPFQGLSPVQSPASDQYVVGGAWGGLPSLFWIVANSLYWLFWINLMLGMTNALPAVPLDGGYLFKDLLDGALRKLKAGMGTEARERVAKNLSLVLALFILGLILWQMIIPRI